MWDTLKRNARKHLSCLRQEIFTTGGGSNPLKEDPLATQVKEIIGNTAEPIENAYDDDALSATNGEVTGSFGTEVEVISMGLEDVNSIQILKGTEQRRGLGERLVPLLPNNAADEEDSSITS